MKLLLMLIYLLTAFGLAPGDSSTVHIYAQTPGGSSTVHIYTQTPGDSSTVHIYTQTPGDSSTVHIYTQTVHRKIQLTNWLEDFLGFEPRVVKLIGKSADRAPSLQVGPWHLPYN